MQQHLVAALQRSCHSEPDLRVRCPCPRRSMQLSRIGWFIRDRIANLAILMRCHLRSCTCSVKCGHQSPAFVVAALMCVRVLLVLCQSCLPNDDHGVTLRKLQRNRPNEMFGNSLDARGRFAISQNRGAEVGSKTCSGLTYLE